jgi:hypothetical protein
MWRCAWGSPYPAAPQLEWSKEKAIPNTIAKPLLVAQRKDAMISLDLDQATALELAVCIEVSRSLEGVRQPPAWRISLHHAHVQHIQ